MNKYQFNPFEISICGYSGLGKTTLICKLIKRLAKKYNLGYVKHNAYKFTMDKEGKDTYLAAESGSHNVSIYSSKKNSMAYLGVKNISALAGGYIANDMVIIEGIKKDPHISKIVLLDLEQKILKEIKQDTIVLKILPNQRDDIDLIENIIFKTFNKKIKKTKLYGLVLTGGYSKRMGQDKAFLNYHNRPQYQHCFNLLDSFCDQTFLSLRKEQKELYQKESKQNKLEKPLHFIYDEFLNMGPIGGILSAQKQYPETAWLVIACDMPNLAKKTLSHLIKKRNPYKLASAFISTRDGLPEPLCAIYEPKSYFNFLNFLAKGKHLCPRKMLIQSDYEAIEPIEKTALDNINTLEDYKKLTN